jgi:ribosomal protein S12 methylthiotransferase accessory factor YcaO
MPEDDARTQALVELMKRSLKARIELRQQTARNLELQDKLEQIKTLEKSLQQRTTPSGTP